MSDTVTAHYGFTLPAVGASQDSWGGKLNANWSSLDTQLFNAVSSVNTSMAGYARLAGADFTGNVSIPLLRISSGGLGTTSDFSMHAESSGDRVLQWRAGGSAWQDYMHAASNSRRIWNSNAGDHSVFWQDGSFQVSNGNAYKPGGGSWGALSDDRVKQNVQPYGSGLDAVCRLAPISFQYNGKGGTIADGQIYYGLSAQSAQAVMPELVHEVPMTGPNTLPGQLATDLGPLLLAVCNAIRELAERLTALEVQSAA